jgi:hypothetical protein
MATAPSCWEDLQNGLVALVQSLGLTWRPPPYTGAAQPLPAGQVYKRQVESDFNVTLPCVLIVLGPGKPSVQGGTFESTEVLYPLRVLYLFLADQSQSVNPDALVWQQQILDALVEWQTLLAPSVATCQIAGCDVDMDPAIDKSRFERQNLDAGGVGVVFDTTRLRQRDRLGG